MIHFALILFTSLGFADSAKFEISGMHCGGCKKSIENKVCDSAKYTKCEAKVIDAEKEIGELVLETKSGSVNKEEVSKLVEAAGYKVK